MHEKGKTKKHGVWQRQNPWDPQTRLPCHLGHFHRSFSLLQRPIHQAKTVWMFQALILLKTKAFLDFFFLLVLLAVSFTQSSKTQQGLLRVQCENRVDLLWIRIVRTKQDSPACSPSKRTSGCQEPYCSAIKKNKICSNMDGRRDYHTKWSNPGRERQIPYAMTL